MIQYETAIGPLFSRWGRRHYSLLLAPAEVVAYPYSRGETWRLAFAMQLPFVKDPGDNLRMKAVVEGLPEESMLHSGVARHPVDSIQEIRLENRWDQHAIVICPIAAAEVRLHMHHREQLKDTRIALQRLYPQIYKEKGFPDSKVMSALKS